MLNRTLFGPLVSLAVFALMAVACGDDSSSAKDEMPSSSSTQELSEETCDEDGSVEECLAECSAKNEGQVKVLWVGNPKYGGYEYSRCEGGSWVKGGITLTCDTADAPIGAFCRRATSVNLFNAGMGAFGSTATYTYAGEGVWEILTGPIKLDEECVKDSVGKKKISSYGDKRENTYYLECAEDGWQFINEDEYYCDVQNAVSGDVCSFSVYGDSVYYLYYPVYSDAEDSVTIYGWGECNYDPVLGCCPKSEFPLGYSPELGFH